MKDRQEVPKGWSRGVHWLVVFAAGALLIWVVKILKETGHDEASGVLLLAVAVATVYLVGRYRNQPKDRNDNREGMQALRLQWLTSLPEEIGVTAYTETVGICAVVMDVNMGKHGYSVLASLHGDASLYTTGTFGVIGGNRYESVREAAAALCIEAEKCIQHFERTTSFPYPDEQRVAFYIRCRNGVLTAVAGAAEIESATHPLFPLYLSAQGVLTHLRLIAQKAIG